ncbi:DUF1501 domain-containing protein [Shimia sp. R11_0]|uniref:DUF1501 domain-containing protein n=1 Tax=Shimia sp. R11_0 TaxID=2821096 RepID=UPI001ADC9B21|nr:DUF1501 domain-containing protein [Shimia sp. R11_0]MBO9478969.1 DUF1501 domain-containing protein [Shimia sp. R11_0]
MNDTVFSRRSFLSTGFLAGCSIAASPLVTPVSFAATRGENRLVVIILRGGMDGLDFLRPPNSEMMTRLRPTLSQAAPSEMMLAEGFTLHPGCAPLYELWQAGELDIVQAVSTPYRHKRSHFDGQDLLEAGTATLGGAGESDGWLNRMLQHMPGGEMVTAYAIGADPMLLSRGAAEVESWSPDVNFVLSSQGARLMQLTMERDPDMAGSLAQAFALASDAPGGGVIEVDDAGMMGGVNEMMAAQMTAKGKSAGRTHQRVASFAAAQLREEARVACFSLGGYDTHARQAKTLQRPLERLSDSLLTLKSELGAEVWGKTTVLAMTEFGRTVAENGSKGTDHGTGGSMILAGGALRGGRLLGQWPGLAEEDLFERRDLMPTDDVRRYAGWAIRESFGLSRHTLETAVFPGMSLGDSPALLS